MSQSPSTNGHAPAGPPLAVPEPSGPRRATFWQKTLTVLVLLYTVAIVLVCAWMYWEGDREWQATLLLFGPRWLFGIPLPVLLVASGIWYRRLLLPLAVATYVLVFPFLGFEAHAPASVSTPVRLRVLTCNVEQNVFDPQKLAEVIRLSEPDVVALQEVKDLTRFVWPQGWHVVDHDKFLLASPYPITELSSTYRERNPVDLAAMRCTVRLPGGDVQIVNLHLRSPRDGLEAVLQNDLLAGAQRLEALIETRSVESQAVGDWVKRAAGSQIVTGDFNMPVESAIFRRDWSWLADAFSTNGAGFGFTKLTTIRGYTYGTRIDHVLYTREWRCVNAWVGRDIGSDHLPLVAEFQ